MKRSAALVLLLLLALCFQTTTGAVQRASKQQELPAAIQSVASYSPNRILIKLKEGVVGTSEPLADRIMSKPGLRSESLQIEDGVSLHTIELDPSVSIGEAIRIASASPIVEFAEPDYIVHTNETTPNDPRFPEQWGLNNIDQIGADISARLAWDGTTGSHNVVVAVTDTGIDITHPDLATNIWVNPGEALNGVDDDGNGFVDDINGWNFNNNNNNPGPAGDIHGTHVSGIIGAVGNNGEGVSGVAWQVKLMALKFISGRSGEISDAIRAINYAVDQRRRGVNVRVINASWGDSAADSRALKEAIKVAGKNGILFVCAAGNGGPDSRGDDTEVTPEYPATWSKSLETVVTVAALDRQDRIATFSNFGASTVTAGAPGVQILSTVPGGYGQLSGTSMATPHVSGIAALIFSREPSVEPEDVRDLIIRTSVPVPALAVKCVSSGRANAAQALSNQVSLPGPPAIATVKTSGELLKVGGIGFLTGVSVVEVDGIAVGTTKYVRSSSLGNATLTALKVKLGTNGIVSTFPKGVPVSLTVFNPSTGERSPAFTYTRQ